MAGDAIGVAVQQPRAAAAANGVRRLAGGCLDLQQVVAIHFHRGDVERAGAGGRPGAGCHAAGAGGGGKAVVLADEEDREFENLCPVQAFKEGPAVDRPVAEEAGDDPVLPPQLDSMGGTGGDGNVGGDHAVGAQHADLEVGDMHRAALAATRSTLPAEELTHHRQGIRALGQGVAVAAVVRQQKIVLPQLGADPHGHRLLTDRGVDGAEHQPFLLGVHRQLLEGSDALHEVVGLLQAWQIQVAAPPGRSSGSIHSCLLLSDGSRAWSSAPRAAASRFRLVMRLLTRSAVILWRMAAIESAAVTASPAPNTGTATAAISLTMRPSLKAKPCWVLSCTSFLRFSLLNAG